MTKWRHIDNKKSYTFKKCKKLCWKILMPQKTAKKISIYS